MGRVMSEVAVSEQILDCLSKKAKSSLIQAVKKSIIGLNSPEECIHRNLGYPPQNYPPKNKVL